MADDAGTVTATPPETDAPPPEQQGPTSWAAAAAPPGAAPPPAANPAVQNPDRSQAQTTTPTSNAQIPTEDAGPPLVMRPKRGGLLGVVDKMADALTGVTRPEVYTDQKGNEYVYHPNLSRGQQWARIGADVARGAAAGFTAGRGAGGEGRAALAGMNVGDQAQAQRKGQEDEMQAKVKQDTTDKANMQMLQMKMAEQSWKATRMQIEASQNDLKFNDYQTDRIKGDGGHWVGDAVHPGDIGDILKVQPDVMSHLVQTGQLRIVDKINPATMKHEGISAYMMPENYGKTMLPPGTVGHHFDPMTHEIKDFNYSDGVSQGQRDLDDTTAAAALKAYNNDQQEQADKEATRKKTVADTNATEEKLPLEKEHLRAEAAAENATANERNAKAAGTKAGNLPTMEDGTIDWTKISPADITTADQIAAGDQKMSDLVGRGSPEQRKYWMQLAEARDPTFTGQKFQNRLDAQKAFTSGDESDQIVSFNQFVNHVQTVNDGINAMRNSKSPYLNTPINKLVTMAKGDTEISRQIAPIIASRTEFQNFLNNNHALHQSDKDEGQKILNENMSPAQIQENSRSMIHTAADRFSDLNDKYVRVFDRNFPGMLSPRSAQTMRTFGLGHYVDRLSILGAPGTNQQRPGVPATAAPGPAPAPGGPARAPAPPPAGAHAIQPMTDGHNYYVDVNGKVLGPA